MKATEISTEHPEFDSYFQNWLYQYVSIPKWQLKSDWLWTNINCKSTNHIDFKLKPIPELAKDLHDAVRVHFYNMRRALHGTGNNGLRGLYRKHIVSFKVWNSKTVAYQDAMIKKLINDTNSKNDTVKSRYTVFEAPRTERLVQSCI